MLDLSEESKKGEKRVEVAISVEHCILGKR